MNLIDKLPKLDLHCHLDGSFSMEYITDTLTQDLNITPEELKSKITAPRNCSSLAEYLTCFDIPLMCLTTPEAITNGVLDVIHQAKKDNLSYIEIRFAPALSVNDNMNYDQICEAAIKGCKLGYEIYNVPSNIILCAMRHHDEDTNLKVLRTGRCYLGNGICALDLAGDEAAFSNEKFAYLFKEAKRLGMPFTIHSGECGSSQNIKVSLELGAKRVGHGIALTKDLSLLEECRRNRLGFELCPTSNYQTKALLPGEAYPLKFFLEQGILATVNTDNRTVSDTTLTRELEFVHSQHNIQEEDLIAISKNSIEISFANDNIKNHLISTINKL